MCAWLWAKNEGLTDACGEISTALLLHSHNKALTAEEHNVPKPQLSRLNAYNAKEWKGLIRNQNDCVLFVVCLGHRR